ncbi:MAG: hypothetical protein ACPLSA_07045, partial [Caldanaerobacter sp.]
MDKQTIADPGVIVASVMQCVKFSGQRHITVVFHGGEPLLLGVEYYEKILNELSKEGLELSVSFQTNLLLYDQNWKAFFKKYKARVSSS